MGSSNKQDKKKVSVFLLPTLRTEDESAAGDKLPRLRQLYQPAKIMLEQIERRIDPELTMSSGESLATVITASDYLHLWRELGQIWNAQNHTRHMAIVTAPLQQCLQTASLVCMANLEPQEWSIWQWHVHDATFLEPPTAIPLCVVNELADCVPHIRALGGISDVVRAGLLRCAAMSWNKGYRKDPLAGKILQWREQSFQSIARQWQQEDKKNSETTTSTTETSSPQKVLPYLRCMRRNQNENGSPDTTENDTSSPSLNNPYEFVPMSDKFSWAVSTSRPNLIMDPPRRGEYHEKPPKVPDCQTRVCLDSLIQQALDTGCDTLIMVVPIEVVQELLQEEEELASTNVPTDNASLTCFVARSSKKSNKIKWSYQWTATADTLASVEMPYGVMEPRVPPPPNYCTDGSNERWSLFPPPPPENISPNYPTDIPPFGKCLEKETSVKEQPWAWQSNVVLDEKDDDVAATSPKKKRGKVVMRKPKQ